MISVSWVIVLMNYNYLKAPSADFITQHVPSLAHFTRLSRGYGDGSMFCTHPAPSRGEHRLPIIQGDAPLSSRDAQNRCARHMFSRRPRCRRKRRSSRADWRVWWQQISSTTFRAGMLKTLCVFLVQPKLSHRVTDDRPRIPSARVVVPDNKQIPALTAEWQTPALADNKLMI